MPAAAPRPAVPARRHDHFLLEVVAVTVVKNRMLIATLLAGVTGFEPVLMDLETIVLSRYTIPLDSATLKLYNNCLM